MKCKYSKVKIYETDVEDKNTTKTITCKEKAEFALKISKKKFLARIVPGEEYCDKHAKIKAKRYNESGYIQYKRNSL